MSTRSGKRIHASIHEDTKTRRKIKRQKNNEEINTTLPTLKKRNNYVTYPKEDNVVENDSAIDQKLSKRKQRNTLIQHNLNTLEDNDIISNTTMVRQTRSNKKINNITEVALESDRNIEVINGKIKSKMSTKNTENKKTGKENNTTVTQAKRKSRKKKSKRSFESESDNVKIVNSNDVCNKSIESIDSFHSANGCSPTQKNLKSPKLTPDVNAKVNHGSKRNTPIGITDGFSVSPSQIFNGTFDKSSSDIKNSTFDKHNNSKENSFSRKRKSNSTSDKYSTVSVNSTYDKLDVTIDKNSKSSLDSVGAANHTYDKSNSSHISITSDQSNTNIILNETPMPEENSVVEFKDHIKPNNIPDDESFFINDSKVSEKSASPKNKLQSTPLKREGTFTLEGQESIVISPKDKVLRRQSLLPSPGNTPFHSGTKKASREKNVLNVTRSIEKRTMSPFNETTTRNTKVMFCSPVNNPAVLSQRKSKIIKSSMKGSNKSFLFDGDESVSVRNGLTRSCKRFFTGSHADAGQRQAKRKRLTVDQEESVQRLSKPRTPNVKSVEASNRNLNKSSTKLPNFSALHQKQFAKMESLVDCQQRKADRARQLLTPSANVDKSAPKVSSVSSQQSEMMNKSNLKQPEVKSGYTRFGFKLNLNVNPFVPSLQSKPNGPLVPSTVGATVTASTSSSRKQLAMKTVMREKSSKSLRTSLERKENRTVIKGVRTNRRFELQMKARNLQLA